MKFRTTIVVGFLTLLAIGAFSFYAHNGSAATPQKQLATIYLAIANRPGAVENQEHDATHTSGALTVDGTRFEIQFISNFSNADMPATITRIGKDHTEILTISRSGDLIESYDMPNTPGATPQNRWSQKEGGAENDQAMGTVRRDSWLKILAEKLQPPPAPVG